MYFTTTLFPDNYSSFLYFTRYKPTNFLSYNNAINFSLKSYYTKLFCSISFPNYIFNLKTRVERQLQSLCI